MTVSLVPVGPGVPPAVASVLKSHEDALRALLQPNGPQPVFPIVSTGLPPATAYPNCVVWLTDLKVLATSDGAAWIRADTGSPV